jgi:hypothetical protein
MRSLLILLALWMVGLVPLPVAADEVRSLFVAEVESRGADEAARNAAFRDALKTVLRRLVHRESLDDPGVRALLVEAPRYVRQFEPVPSAAGESPGTRLRVAFAGAALLQALEARGIPAWGPERPLLLVWLVADDNSQRRWAADVLPEAAALMEQAAADKGLPLRLPGLDGADRQALSPDAVAGGAGDNLRSASARYGAAAILAGHLSRKSETVWETAWHLYHGDDSRVWNDRGSSLQQALGAGFAGAYDALVLADDTPEEASRVLEVTITEIRAPGEFRRARRLLQSLAGARNVEPVGVTADSATFRLEAPGGQDALARHAESTGELIPAGDETYRLAP